MKPKSSMRKITVYLTSYNHAKYIRDAIESVLNQSFTNFTLIIVDDASTDDSWSIISGYDDSRILSFRNEKVTFANCGFDQALALTGKDEFIAIHHSDDIWEVEKLATQVKFLQAHPSIGAVFTNAQPITEDGSSFALEDHFYFNIFNQPNRTRHEWLRFFFTHGNALCHPSVLIRKCCYEDCGLYNYGFVQIPDFDMWIRLCLKYDIHVLPGKFVKFRVRDNEANASGSRPETRIRLRYEFHKVLQNYRKLDSFNDLVKVFPSSEKYYRKQETDLEFALAMVMLEEESHTFAKLFSLDILFEAISDPKREANIKRLYDFDRSSFIALTGQHDVFSLAMVAQRDG